MPVVGLSTIQKKTMKLAGDISDRKVAAALTAGAIVGQAYSAMLTPVDTGNLYNSQYRKLEKVGSGWRVGIGYTAAYAAAVHSKKATGKGKPRANGNGNYWDPNAEPEFLRKGFEDHRPEVERAIMKVFSN